jgi:serine/threonine-protein kinase
MSDLNKAIELNKDYETSYYYRAQVKYAAQDDNGCIEDCNKSLALTKKHDVFYTRGIAKFGLKDYSGAIEDFNEALKLKKDYALATLERGVTYYMLEKDELAMADLNSAINLNTKNARAYYFRGKLKKYKNDTAGSCEGLKISLKLGYSWAQEDILKNGCK